MPSVEIHRPYSAGASKKFFTMIERNLALGEQFCHFIGDGFNRSCPEREPEISHAYRRLRQAH